MRQREHDMDVGQIQQFLFASSEPLVTSISLTLGAMAVTTRIIRDSLMAAARTLIQMATQRRRTTALNGA